METTRPDPILGSIRLLFEVGTVAGMSDGQLLGRFLEGRDLDDSAAAEVAFAAIVERHGPMVLRVCRARLGDDHDAQDAFQATFLILARKAATIRRHDSAASWLQGVARRVASCARRASAVRRSKEREAAGRTPEVVAGSPASEVVPAVREEVSDLPEKYRAPLMLCLLDGLTHEEAAARLGWPVGTVKTRVRRAKDQLRARLTRRGLAPSLAAIGVAMAESEARATMPAALVRATARAAMTFATDPVALSATVARLVELGLGSLIMSRWKVAAMVITSFGAFAAGATGFARQGSSPVPQAKPVEARPVAKDAPKPVPADVPQGGRLDEIEAATLDLELLEMEVNNLKQRVNAMMQNRLRYQWALRSLTEPTPEFEGGARLSPQAFEASKKQYTEALTQADESLGKARAEYLAKSLELKRERHRLEQLQKLEETPKIQAPPAGSSPQPTGTHEADRLDRLKEANIRVDVLRMDVDRWRERLKAAHQKVLDLRDQQREFRKPKGMTDREFEAEADQLRQKTLDAGQDLEEANTSFERSSRSLVQQERQLRDMSKDLPLSAQVEFSRWAAESSRPAEARPSAEVDRRLSDLERKLDLILKAIEKPGR